MTQIYPVILAGGTGSRLWPASRKNYPKQFMQLVADETLLQKSASRLSGLTNNAPLLVCSNEHRFLAAEQMIESGIESADILLEPSARNTTAAIACAAWQLLAKDPNAVMVVMPADHLIEETEKFQNAVADAAKFAQETQKIVTLGVKPTYAETGYGYIEASAAEKDSVSQVVDVARFVEKPQKADAEKYISSGNFFWNAGIFIMSAAKILSELERNEPETHRLTQLAVARAESDLDFLRLEQDSFDACSSISIDYSVMEKSEDLAVLPYEGSWSDIGSWDALHRNLESDESGNSTYGDAIAQDCNGCLVHSTSRLVVAKGLKNICVIETDDAVYVVDKAMAQQTKEVVELLEADGREEVENHKTCYRPWGHYTSLKHGTRYQVKRITVKPGAKLSLQKHFHRSEHWVVVNGTAEVTNGDKEVLLYENESIYIPLGNIHRLHNPGSIPLELIEVQSGSYLGEDDIVRIGDDYGRN